MGDHQPPLWSAGEFRPRFAELVRPIGEDIEGEVPELAPGVAWRSRPDFEKYRLEVRQGNPAAQWGIKGYADANPNKIILLEFPAYDAYIKSGARDCPAKAGKI